MRVCKTVVHVYVLQWMACKAIARGSKEPPPPSPDKERSTRMCCILYRINLDTVEDRVIQSARACMFQNHHNYTKEGPPKEPTHRIAWLQPWHGMVGYKVDHLLMPGPGGPEVEHSFFGSISSSAQHYLCFNTVYCTMTSSNWPIKLFNFRLIDK